MKNSVKPSRRISWKWLATLFLGAFSWISSYYFLRLRRQPAWKQLPLPANLLEHNTVFDQGFHIAQDNLLSCIEARLLPSGETKRVLCAGRRNFREPWARDLSFAAFGLLELGNFDVVRESLEVFLQFQTPEGQFPVKVYSTRIFDRFLHSLFRREQPTQAPLKPKYISGHRTISLDGNLLLVVASLAYIAKTEDIEFAHSYGGALRRAIRWVETNALNGDCLIFQDAFSDWADSLARTGEVLYTNVLYWKALAEMALYAKKYASKEETAEWSQLADCAWDAIQRNFWRSDLGYFVTSSELDNLSSSGNLLAIAWGLATPEQGGDILAAIKRFGMDYPVPTQVMHGEYSQKSIAIENRLAGIPEYHTRGAWLWLGAWHVIATLSLGDISYAQDLLERIMKTVLRDKAVYEVYGLDGRFLSTRWYTAEVPLSWNAGMIIYAIQTLRRVSARETI